MSAKIAVIYYSSTGCTFELAKAVAEGARQTGAEVRLLKVKELAPEEAIAANEGWAQHRQATQQIQEATLDDLEWADALIMGTPTRYGLPSSQMKQFMDTTGPLWAQGKLVNKIASSFTSTATQHGGQESTILAMNNVFYHWGCVIVSPGYADPIQFQVGNPYGISYASSNGQNKPDATVLEGAKFHGKRVAEITARFASDKQAERAPV